jgi:hypothetical protein
LCIMAAADLTAELRSVGGCWTRAGRSAARHGPQACPVRPPRSGSTDSWPRARPGSPTARPDPIGARSRSRLATSPGSCEPGSDCGGGRTAWGGRSATRASFEKAGRTSARVAEEIAVRLTLRPRGQLRGGVAIGVIGQHVAEHPGVHAREAGVPEDQRESLDEPQQRVGVLLILFDGRHRRQALSAVFTVS